MGSRAVVAAWLAVFFLLGMGVWEFQAGELILIGYLAASALAYAAYALYRRCPGCRMPVLLRPVRCLGIEFYLWTLSPPRSCRHCGKPLTVGGKDGGGKGPGDKGTSEA